LSDTPLTIAASATDEDGTYSADNTLQVTVQPASVNPDTTAPTAVLTAPGVTTAGGTSYSFTVVFSDDQGVLAADLNDADVIVTGPNGFSQAGHLVSVDNSSDGTPRTAVYSITPPGGAWNYTVNGYYTISLNDNAVHDINGNAEAGGVLGGFKVAAPVPDLGGSTLDTAAYMGIMSPTYNQTIQDYVSKTDRHDYYRVRIKSNMTIDSKLYGMTDNVDLQLLDGNGRVIATSAKTGTTSDSISRMVTPGTYYLHVYYSGTSSSTYWLRISGSTIATASTSKPAAVVASAFSTSSHRKMLQLLDAPKAA
jgi:hypothetical protein